MPLVLHGGTGIPDDMIKKAISLGVAKINVNTECQLAFAAATRKYIEEGKDEQGKGLNYSDLKEKLTNKIYHFLMKLNIDNVRTPQRMLWSSLLIFSFIR